MYYSTNNICMMKPRRDLFPYLALKNWNEGPDDWISIRMNNSWTGAIWIENFRLPFISGVSGNIFATIRACRRCWLCINFPSKLYFGEITTAVIFHISKTYFSSDFWWDFKNARYDKDPTSSCTLGTTYNKVQLCYSSSKLNISNPIKINIFHAAVRGHDTLNRLEIGSSQLLQTHQTEIIDFDQGVYWRCDNFTETKELLQKVRKLIIKT